MSPANVVEEERARLAIAPCTLKDANGRMLERVFDAPGWSTSCSVSLVFTRLVTYTLPEEGGVSLRSAGLRLVGPAGGGRWSSPACPGRDATPLCRKPRWEAARPANCRSANPSDMQRPSPG